MLCGNARDCHGPRLRTWCQGCQGLLALALDDPKGCSDFVAASKFTWFHFDGACLLLSRYHGLCLGLQLHLLFDGPLGQVILQGHEDGLILGACNPRERL